MLSIKVQRGKEALAWGFYWGLFKSQHQQQDKSFSICLGGLRGQSCACPCWSRPLQGLEYSSCLTWDFLHLSNISWRAESLQRFLLVGFSPERDNEVNELLADPGPVPQWGVIVHPLPRDGDEGGMHIFITHLHCNRNCSFSPRPMLCQSQKRKFWQLSS